MVRKIATQIPAAVSRLLQAKTIPPPVWYQAVLTHSPTPLPPRPSGNPIPTASSSTTTSIASSSSLLPSARRKTLRSNKAHGYKPRPIVYEEDDIRRRFFQDFPFEALRSVTLVEGRHVGEDEGIFGMESERLVNGREWTSLGQRGAYPTVEDTIAYTLNLHHAHSLSLSESYLTAVRQFSELRAQHELATFQAEEERLVLGKREEEEGVVGGRGKGSKDVFQRFFDLELRQRQTFLPTASQSTSHSSPSSTPQGPPSSMTRRRAWRPTVPPQLTKSVTGADQRNNRFTGGLEYSAGWIGEVWKGAMRGSDSVEDPGRPGGVVAVAGGSDTVSSAAEASEEHRSALDAKIQSVLSEPVQSEVLSR